MYEKLNIIRFKSKFCLSSKTAITSATLVAADRRSRDTVCSSLLNGSVTDNMSQRQKIVRMKSLQHMACISQLALIEESRSSQLETIVRLFTISCREHRNCSTASCLSTHRVSQIPNN